MMTKQLLNTRSLWLVVPPAIMALWDAGITSYGQSQEYWTGNSSVASESSPSFATYLTIHPVYFLAMAGVWIPIFGAIVLLLRRDARDVGFHWRVAWSHVGRFQLADFPSIDLGMDIIDVGLDRRGMETLGVRRWFCWHRFDRAWRSRVVWVGSRVHADGRSGRVVFDSSLIQDGGSP
ncbi:MAG: hypothetical protein AAF989_06075 [Planctomycetota bacterium]